MLSWFSSLALSFSLLSPAHALTPPTVSPAIVSGRYNREDAVLVIVNESYQNLPQVLYPKMTAVLFSILRNIEQRPLGERYDLKCHLGKNTEQPVFLMANRRGGTVVYYVGMWTVTASVSGRRRQKCYR